MKHKRCALRRWCKRHGYTVANGYRPDLPYGTRVNVLLGPNHPFDTMGPNDEHYTQNFINWRWEFSKFPSSDIYAWKVVP